MLTVAVLIGLGTGFLAALPVITMIEDAIKIRRTLNRTHHGHDSNFNSSEICTPEQERHPKPRSESRRGKRYRRKITELTRRFSPPQGCPPQGRELSLMVAEVASRLRAGAPVNTAWEKTWNARGDGTSLGGIDDEGVPIIIRSYATRMTAQSIRSPSDLFRYFQAITPRGRSSNRAAQALVAACRFTGTLGAPLAEVLEIIADGVDEAETAEHARTIASSGPRSSARILTALPVLGVVVAHIIGARPIERWSDGAIGTVSVVIGVVCFTAGQLLSARMLAAVRRRADRVDEAILCDLAVAGLRSGASISSILQAIGRAADLEELERIGRELTFGVDWERAWDTVPEGTELLERCLESAWREGNAPIPLLTRGAASLRARRATDARIEAEKIGVRLVIPLAALLLPAFICLGIVPVLMHLGHEGFGTFFQ